MSCLTLEILILKIFLLNHNILYSYYTPADILTLLRNSCYSVNLYIFYCDSKETRGLTLFYNITKFMYCIYYYYYATLCIVYTCILFSHTDPLYTFILLLCNYFF